MELLVIDLELFGTNETPIGVSTLDKSPSLFQRIDNFAKVSSAVKSNCAKPKIPAICARNFSAAEFPANQLSAEIRFPIPKPS